MSEKHSDRIYYLAILGLIVATFVIGGLTLVFSDETNKWFIKENGLVETLSLVGYFVAVAAMWFRGGKAYLMQHWYFAVAFLAFAAREMDFDKRFTELGVMKSRFLVSPDISITTKIISYTILAFIAFALLKIVQKHGREFLAKVFSFKFNATVLGVSLAGGFLVISKILDGNLVRLLGRLGIEVSEAAARNIGKLEEVVEFPVPYFFAVAVLAFVSLGQNRTPMANSTADQT